MCDVIATQISELQVIRSWGSLIFCYQPGTNLAGLDEKRGRYLHFHIDDC